MLSSSNKIPVIFFHLGEHQHFSSAIKIASKKNEVIVIGNQSENFIFSHPKISFFSHEKYSQDVEDFQKVYEHLHKSDYSLQLICYTRWLAIRNLCREKNISRFFYADSDVAVLCDVTQIFQYVNAPFALMTQDNQPEYRWVASAHCSYWDLNSIEKFCKFIFDSYTKESLKNKLLEKFEWHIKNSKDGGVCDMTQLFLFSKENDEHASLTKIFQNSCFDDNVNSSENFYPNEYAMHNGIKALSLLEDKNIFFTNVKGEKVLANSIHCQGQGGAKMLLKSLEKLVYDV